MDLVFDRNTKIHMKVSCDRCKGEGCYPALANELFPCPDCKGKGVVKKWVPLTTLQIYLDSEKEKENSNT